MSRHYAVDAVLDLPPLSEMKRTLTEVLVARERLLVRNEQQRAVIHRACMGLAGPAAMIDRAADCGRYLRAHPAALAGLIGTLLLLRGRSVLSIATRGLAFWRLGRRVRSLMRLFER